MRMFNPPHPGTVLRDYLEDVPVTAAARHLGITRAALSRIVNGSAGISAEMALRLGRLGLRLAAPSPEGAAPLRQGLGPAPHDDEHEHDDQHDEEVHAAMVQRGWSPRSRTVSACGGGPG